MSKFKIIN